MNTVIAWVRAEPTRSAAIATIILGWLALAGVPETVVAGLGTILAVVIGGPIRNAVMPTAKAVEAVRDATHEAADTVASQLGEQSVGDIGVLTSSGEMIAGQAATLAAEAALQAAGVSRKDRSTAAAAS